MVAEVCLGKGEGVICAREVSRFRHATAEIGQQLIEMCRVVDTVLVDRETIYAPRNGNDRLLLGLKEASSEVRGSTFCANVRSSARYLKARRSELVVAKPIALSRLTTVSRKIRIGACKRRSRWFSAWNRRKLGSCPPSARSGSRSMVLIFRQKRTNSDTVWRRPCYACSPQDDRKPDLRRRLCLWVKRARR